MVGKERDSVRKRQAGTSEISGALQLTTDWVEARPATKDRGALRDGGDTSKARRREQTETLGQRRPRRSCKYCA